MESAEILVYLIIAIIIGGLVVIVTKSVDYERFYKSNAKAMDTEKGTEFKIESTQLAAEIAKRWQECRLGLDNVTFAVFVTDNATVSREFLVNELLRIDQCHIIDCRNRTNSFFVAPGIGTPKIINIACFNYTLSVR